MIKRILSKLDRGRLTFAALITAFLALGIIAVIHIVSMQAGYVKAQDEYDILRLYAPDATPFPDAAPQGQAAPKGSAPATLPQNSPPPDLVSMNPDYTGWIRIDGTGIDYPVVRGEDNDKYLTTTFGGEKNPSGTIFMDYRCAEGWDAPLAILHGHNMKDGSMFAELNKLPESGYLDEHREITIVTQDGETLNYSIFAVVKTNVYDAAFTLHSGDTEDISVYMDALSAPEGAQRYIALSTCTDGNDDERLLVVGAVVS